MVPPADTRPASGSEEHFSLVLDHSPTGWAAHCESGCSWKDVTLQCTNCKVSIDADGMYGSDLPARSRGFAFVLDDSNGLSAHGVRGTRWANLSWGCTTAVCRSRINEEGVHVAS
ncbi:MAG: hypothetical protein ACJ796_05230 [Gemmatimonadaceae bacterium]